MTFHIEISKPFMNMNVKYLFQPPNGQFYLKTEFKCQNEVAHHQRRQNVAVDGRLLRLLLSWSRYASFTFNVGKGPLPFVQGIAGSSGKEDGCCGHRTRESDTPLPPV
jgi:hypothetical protein